MSTDFLIAKHLSNYRRLQKISQESLAIKLGKHRTFVSKVENENRILSFVELQKYCNALNIDITIFL